MKASSIDPYVMLQVFGIPNDCAEARTKTVSNEGQNPIFDESFEFTITAPQLAVLRLTVLDDDFIGMSKSKTSSPSPKVYRPALLRIHAIRNTLLSL